MPSCQCPLHRRDHDVAVRRALAAENPVGAERHVRCNALEAGGRVIGADDARDVRSMAAAVVRIRIRRRHRIVGGCVGVGVESVADEVIAIGDALRSGRGDCLARDAVAAECRVIDVDARVHHRDLDALARVAELVLRDVGAGHGDRGVEVGRRGRSRVPARR